MHYGAATIAHWIMSLVWNNAKLAKPHEVQRLRAVELSLVYPLGSLGLCHLLLIHFLTGNLRNYFELLAFCKNLKITFINLSTLVFSLIKNFLIKKTVRFKNIALCMMRQILCIKIIKVKFYSLWKLRLIVGCYETRAC